MKHLITTTTILITLASAVYAHGKATGIVRERMDGMVILEKTMKSLDQMAIEATAFDPDILQDLAKKLSDHAGENLTRLFPEGSMEHSEATLGIWADWQDFENIANQLADLADELALITDKTSLAPKIAQINKTCKSCHTFYRENTK